MLGISVLLIFTMVAIVEIVSTISDDRGGPRPL